MIQEQQRKPVVKTLVKKINLRVGWDIIADPKMDNQIITNDKYKCGLCHKFLILPCPQELQENEVTRGYYIEGKLTKGKCNCVFHEKCMSGYINAGNVSCPHCNTPWIKDKELRSLTIHGNIENLTVRKPQQN